MSTFTTHYDVPSGVFKCSDLTAVLTARALQPVKVLTPTGYAYQPHDLAKMLPYGVVPYRGGMSEMFNDAVIQEVLVRQRRTLGIWAPQFEPELRASLPHDFGRKQIICWYAPGYEDFVLFEDAAIPELSQWLIDQVRDELQPNACSVREERV